MPSPQTLITTVPRRRLLATVGAAVTALGAGPLLTGCDTLSTEPSGSEGQGTGGDSGSGAGQRRKGTEAPQLAAQVRAGKLPPLEKRLPAEPLVVTPIDTPGVYGGEWHTLIPEVEAYDAYGKLAYDNLVRWDPGWTKIVPNIARSWTIHRGGREFVFELREGMKWSDGQPFTADDVVFAYDDVLTEPKLFPEVPTWLVVGNRPATVEKVDDLTVRVSFAVPHGFFLERLASPDGNVLSALPRHYLQRFHPKYNPAAQRQAKQQGFADWPERFFNRGGGGLLDLGPWQNPALPVLLAWRVTTPMTGSRLVMERNPYYWKTDPDGSQLPYLDRVVADVGLEPSVAVVKIAHGEYSVPDSAALEVSDKPVYARNRGPGKFHFVRVLNADCNTATVMFNLLHKDPALRQVFQSRDFRVGLSYAINRDELIAAVFQRQGEPFQAAPRPESDFYDEGLAKQYTGYDRGTANAHLDRAGLDRRDGDGMRLRPDGRPLTFTLKFILGWHAYFPDVAERIRDYWRAVGVDVAIKGEEQTKFGNDMPTNTHECVMWGGDNGMLDAMMNPGLFFPFSEGSYFAIPWGLWYATGGKQGQRPPAAPRRQMELYDRIKQTLEAAAARVVHGAAAHRARAVLRDGNRAARGQLQRRPGRLPQRAGHLPGRLDLPRPRADHARAVLRPCVVPPATRRPGTGPVAAAVPDRIRSRSVTMGAAGTTGPPGPAAPALGPTGRQTSVEQANEALGQAICSGQLEPGQKLVLTALASALGMSVTPVREALRQLQREGLVVDSPYAGMRVSRLSRDELLDLFEIRGVLDGLATARGATRLQRADLRRARELIEAMERAIADDDPERFMDLNAAFHAVFIGPGAPAGGALATITAQVTMRTRRYSAAGRHALPRSALRASNRQHRQILARATAGDTAALEDLCRRHAAAFSHNLAAALGFDGPTP